MALTKVSNSMRSSAPVSVKDHGAVGDGVTDDTAAIQAALDSGAKSIIFPSGIYIHTSVLTVSSDTAIFGYGATIKAQDGLNKTIGGLLLASAQTIHIDGLVYDGNRSNRSPSAPVGSAHGIFLQNASSIVFNSVVVQNAVADGVCISESTPGDVNTRSSNIRFLGGQISNSYRNGLSITAAYDVKAFGTKFNNTNGTAPQSGVDVEADNSATYCSDVEFHACRFDTNTGDGLTISQYARKVKVFGGFFTGNTLRGIDIPSTNQAVDTIIDGASIANNTSDGIRNLGSKTIISNCVISSNGGSGIAHTGSSSKAKITNNIVYNNNAGIVTSGPNHEIIGNDSYDNTSTSGWNISVGGDKVRLIGNRCVSSLGASGCYGINVNSANATALGNYATGNQDNGGKQIIGVAANTISASDNYDGTLAKNIGNTMRGATASVADGGTITHALGATPSSARVTTSIANEFASVTALGASTITVAIKKHDGTAGTTQTIYWDVTK